MKPTMRFSGICMCLLAIAVIAVAHAENPGTDDAKVKSAETVVRERFLLAYQTAQTPERKAETIEMLRGLKEKESQRLMAGMLFDRNDNVRKNACLVMAATPDPDGYFVKPLMGVLADPKQAVRIAAADALGNAIQKAGAIKALAFSLMSAVGSKNVDAESKAIDAYDRALEKLTAQKSEARDPRGLSNFWMDYWKKNGDELKAAESQAQYVEPVRPENLPKDSLDK
jgi:hypothetical protein